MSTRATFRRMQDSTAEDWRIITGEFMPFAARLPERVLGHLALLEGDYGGFPVDRHTHCRQTATRALRDGRDEEYVVVALLHDIGEALGPLNHGEVIASICAEELSYSHSNAKIDTKASLLNGIATANYKWTSLEYKDPTIRVVGPAAIVRFNFVGEQEFTDGKKTPQNLHVLMNWQKQGNDWKLLSRAATKL